MPLSRRHKGDTAQEWKTGEGRMVLGSKYTTRFDPLRR